MPPSNRTDMSQLGRAWAISLDLVSNLVAGLLLGAGIDWLVLKISGHKTFPILMLVFAGLGFASGLLRFFRETARLNREMSRNWKREHPPGDRPE